MQRFGSIVLATGVWIRARSGVTLHCDTPYQPQLPTVIYTAQYEPAHLCIPHINVGPLAVLLWRNGVLPAVRGVARPHGP